MTELFGPELQLQLQVQLDAANSDELRSLRAYIGFGKPGTEETNTSEISASGSN